MKYIYAFTRKLHGPNFRKKKKSKSYSFFLIFKDAIYDWHDHFKYTNLIPRLKIRFINEIII